jgi:hypothetical protein
LPNRWLNQCDYENSKRQSLDLDLWITDGSSERYNNICSAFLWITVPPTPEIDITKPFLEPGDRVNTADAANGVIRGSFPGLVRAT